MKQPDGDKPAKGILATGSKQNGSKGRRVSWGAIRIKEFTKNGEVHSQSEDEFHGTFNRPIMEERSEIESDLCSSTDPRQNNNPPESSNFELPTNNINTNFLSARAEPINPPRNIFPSINNPSTNNINTNANQSLTGHNIQSTQISSNNIGSFNFTENNSTKAPSINNLQNPFLKNINNLPITNQFIDVSSDDFDLLNTSKKRYTVRSISDIFVDANASGNKKDNDAMDVDEEKKNSNRLNSMTNQFSSSLNSNTSGNTINEQTIPTENIKHITNTTQQTAKFNLQKTFESDKKHFAANSNTQTVINNIPQNDPSSNLNINNASSTTKINNLQPKSDSNSNLPANNINNSKSSRLTLNLKDIIMTNNEENSIQSDKDKSLNDTRNKRYTISMQELLGVFNNDEQEDELENSFEERLKQNQNSNSGNNNISASPINVKSQKLYYETCLSSASRCIETTEAKNQKEDQEVVKNINIPAKNEEETPKFDTEEKYNKRYTFGLFESGRVSLPSFIHDKSPIQTKNPVIHANNLISPVASNFAFLKIAHESDVDKRINEVLSSLGECNKQTIRDNSELQKGIAENLAKLKEFEDESCRIQNEKQKIRENIEKLEKKYHEINDRKVLLSFGMKQLGIKILSSQFNVLKIQILNQINLTFGFKKFSIKSLTENINKGNNDFNMVVEKLSFDLIKLSPNLTEKLTDNTDLSKFLKGIYEAILSYVIGPSQYGIPLTQDQFLHILKQIIKFSGSFLYLVDVIQIILAASLKPMFNFKKESMLLSCNFAMLNKLGLKATFTLDLEVLNAFFGVTLKEGYVTNMCLSDSDYTKCKRGMLSFIEEVKSYISMKNKLVNPLFLKELITKLHENVLTLYN